MLNQLKEQNKQIWSKLGDIEKKLGNGSEIDQANVTEICFPMDLPLKTKDDLKIFEDHLKEKRHVEQLILHFNSLGGNNNKLIIHNILRRLLTDEVASLFSYYGKRGKEPFYILCVNEAIIKAVQSKHINRTEVEETIKLWIKHALDRIKSRNMRKSDPTV